MEIASGRELLSAQRNKQSCWDANNQHTYQNPHFASNIKSYEKTSAGQIQMDSVSVYFIRMLVRVIECKRVLYLQPNR